MHERAQHLVEFLRGLDARFEALSHGISPLTDAERIVDDARRRSESIDFGSGYDPDASAEDAHPWA